ncbi:MAG TPA: hypothetical protein VJQ25_12660 [Nitrospira sp.]|nr:hypothetical protein [Nitrospira sp.]
MKSWLQAAMWTSFAVVGCTHAVMSSGAGYGVLEEETLCVPT